MLFIANRVREGASSLLMVVSIISILDYLVWLFNRKKVDILVALADD